MSGPLSVGEDRGRLVAVLGQHQLGDVALGAGPAAGDGAVGAAQVEHVHRLDAWRCSGRCGRRRRRGARGGRRTARRASSPGIDMPPCAAADAHALVAERGAGDGPAAVDRADDVVVGHEHVVEEDLVELRVAGRSSCSGRTSTPSACMSMTIVVMPSCFGHVGVGPHGGEARSRLTWAPLVHTFWPLTSQPPSTRVPLVLMPAASEPASGSLNSWHQMTSWSRARPHPARDLVVGGVLDQREDHPAGDAVRRPLDAGGRELLLDHELLDRAGAPAPRLGPVRHDVAGLDQRGPRWPRRRGRRRSRRTP